MFSAPCQSEAARFPWFKLLMGFEPAAHKVIRINLLILPNEVLRRAVTLRMRTIGNCSCPQGTLQPLLRPGAIAAHSPKVAANPPIRKTEGYPE